MARFGDRLRALRESLGMNQKEAAARLRTAKGEPMEQSSLSKMELLEFSPRPDTVYRLAEGYAPLLNTTPAAVVADLLEGVPSRYDAVAMRRAVGESSGDVNLDQIITATMGLPEAKRHALLKEMTAMVAKAAERSRKS